MAYHANLHTGSSFGILSRLDVLPFTGETRVHDLADLGADRRFVSPLYGGRRDNTAVLYYVLC